VARNRCGAGAISLPTWLFWACSHAVTALYCAEVAHDLLRAGMMSGHCAGAGTVATLTMMKRRASTLRAVPEN
jgi:hypothetical protein